MATFKFYKSESVDGGNIGDELVNGGIDDLLPPISAIDRQNGITILRKFWVESDEDVTLFSGMNNGYSEGDVCIFKSANDDDTVADLTGDESKFGTMRITANTSTDITVAHSSHWGCLLRAGDRFILDGADLYTVDTITDNGDGTSTLTTTSDFPDSDYTDKFVNATIEESVTANTPIPYWYGANIPEGSAIGSGYLGMVYSALYS